MSEAPDTHALARQVAVLKERMNTMDERYDKGWALLREDMAKRDAEAAKRDAEAAKRDAARAERDAARAERDATARWWQTAILIAALAALITFAPDLQRLAAGL